MGNPSMKVLADGGGKFCKEPRKKDRECDKSTNANTVQCDNFRQTAQKCEKAVQKAFRDINMSGCPKEIKMTTLCEDEWCHHQLDGISCKKECAGVRELLSVCVQQHVMHYFKRNGLKENGSTA